MGLNVNTMTCKSKCHQVLARRRHKTEPKTRKSKKAEQLGEQKKAGNQKDETVRRRGTEKMMESASSTK